MEDKSRTVEDFYSEKCEKLDFVCKVNNRDLTPAINEIVAQIHPETMKRYYGSGLIIPDFIEGKKVLDIGCGSGSLVFILSKLVGPNGSVTGIDFTSNLIEQCKLHEDYHRQKWGFEKKNTEFFVGNAENLKEFQDNSFDILVSNGVFCLIHDKDSAFEAASRVLKEGGEFYMSDVYTNQRPPAEMMAVDLCWVLGLTGSQSVADYKARAARFGFSCPVYTGVGPINISEYYKGQFPGSRYACATNRLFRLPSGVQKDAAAVTYKGTIPGKEESLPWDIYTTLPRGNAVTVDGDLAAVLKSSRFRDCFGFAPAKDSVQEKEQNPFDYMDQLAAEGTTLEYVYKVE